MKKAGFSIFSLLPLWMSFGSVAAFDESKICYILDAILFIYGVVLTVLYCRMKLLNENKKSSSHTKKDAAEGVYEAQCTACLASLEMSPTHATSSISLCLSQGLAPRTEDTYETIQMNKTKA